MWRRKPYNFLFLDKSMKNQLGLLKSNEHSIKTAIKTKCTRKEKVLTIRRKSHECQIDWRNKMKLDDLIT